MTKLFDDTVKLFDDTVKVTDSITTYTTEKLNQQLHLLKNNA